MAAPSSTVPPTNNEVSFFTYVREVLSETATLLQEAPVAVAAEAAGLMEDVPVVSVVCKTFLAFEQLVDTARSNKEDLATLLELCGVVIEGLLNKRWDRSGLFKGFTALEKHVNKAREVAELCNGAGRVARFVLARKISRDVASARHDVLDFCATNDLVLTNDILVSLSRGVSLVLAARA